MLAIAIPSNSVKSLRVSILRIESAKILPGLCVTHEIDSNLSFEHIDRFISAHRNEESAIRRISDCDSAFTTRPNCMHEVFVMRIGMIEDKGRTLIERDQHIIRRTHKAERTTGTEIHAVHTTRMA